MRAVTKYEDNNGNLHNTAAEAMTADKQLAADKAIENLVSDNGFGNSTSSIIVNFIKENRTQLADIFASQYTD